MMIEPFGCASDTELAIFEAAFGVKLPADYREFLLQKNGGKAQETLHFVEELGEVVAVDVFYGIAVHRSFDLVRINKEYQSDLPAGYLLIGQDAGAAWFVLATGEGAGAVYFYDHQHYFPQSSAERNAYKLADSFSEFLNG